jgi:riboflavin kinase / FMN adenylyltransferase
VETETGTVSSSAIRDALLGGNLDMANEMLGYSYFMRGKIVEGRKLGRTIGFPTANINPDSREKLIPMNGVYAVEIIIGEKRYKGVMSIGINPTVNRNPDKRTIEVNIFRFRREIYGTNVTVIFRYRLRDEKAFSTLDELAAQIKADKKQALSLLG